ncbi:MAG: helix-turn-helix domain-containing protein [Patescibacteria group bacterium]|jgi:cytoskeletal protein RodZ
MPIFQKHSIERSKTLGERLQKVRRESGIGLEEAEKQTGIKKKYLEAIENGEYGILPGPVYIESFLKKYAIFLNVNEGLVIDIYRQQERKIIKKKFKPSFEASRQKLPQPIITPKTVRKAIIILIILACLTYVGFEVAKIFSPPLLTISSPSDFSTVTQNNIQVTGKTAPEARLTINGREVYLESDGSFTETVNLKEDLNVIEITAIKQRSKPTTVLRNVFLKNNN